MKEQRERGRAKTLSVIVSTYNSSHTVLDTLNSLYGQNRREIDLIVTDDSSSDNTVKIVQGWIEIHKEDFRSVCLVTSKVNTGVTENALRGLRECGTDYFKFIAGDDVFTAGSVDRILEAINEPGNGAVDIFVGKIYQFTADDLVYDLDRHDISCPYERYTYEPELVRFAEAKSLGERLNHLTTIAPGLVVKTKSYRRAGGFDRAYPNIEDLPFIIRCCEKGLRFQLMDDYLVYYRKSCHAATNRKETEQYANLRFYRDFDRYYREHLRALLLGHKKYALFLDYELSAIRTRLVIRYGHNRKGGVYKATKLLMLFNPRAVKNIVMGVGRRKTKKGAFHE